MKFFSLLKRYLKKYNYSNVEQNDLCNELTAVSIVSVKDKKRKALTYFKHEMRLSVHLLTILFTLFDIKAIRIRRQTTSDKFDSFCGIMDRPKWPSSCHYQTE
jgi:hypothetical protein